MSQAEPIDHEVSMELASLIPDDVRDNPEQLKDWLNRALEIGLKAMIQGSGAVDLSFVSNEFEGWKDGVSEKLIGKDSDFEKGLENWFKDPDGEFQKALDLDNKKSPFSKFLATLKTDATTHETAVTNLVSGILTEIGKDKAPKQAKEMGDIFEEDIEWYLNNSGAKVMDDDIAVVGEDAIKGSGGAKTGDVLIKVEDPAAKKLRITIEAKAGKSKSAYTEKGLWEQMSENMTLRKAQAGIGVVDINNAKKHDPWLTKGRYQIIVAVDRERNDFTLLKIAYHFLRTRIIQDELDKKKGKKAKTQGLDLAGFEDQLTTIIDRLKSIKGLKGNLTRAQGILKTSQEDLDSIKEGIDEDVEELLKLLKKAKSTGS